MSQGHYYQQETGVLYQTLKREEQPILFCGMDITSWFFSSKYQKEEIIHFMNNDLEQPPEEEENTNEENELLIQETNLTYWNIAKIVLISVSIGIILTLFSI